MKIKSLFVTVLLMAGVVVAPIANAADDLPTYPKLESFTVSPDDIDLGANNATVTFTLVVSHPVGIKSEKTIVRLTNNAGFGYEVAIARTDNPIDFSKKQVTFQGRFKLPQTMPNGVYTFTADPVSGFISLTNRNTLTGNAFIPGKIRPLIDAESALLVRLNGKLDFDFQTFVGPTYYSTTFAADSNPRTLGAELPIWKVGEIFSSANYFEMRTKDVSLGLKSSTPLICKSDGKNLSLIAEGHCVFTVFTTATNDFKYKDLTLTAEITSARNKPEILPEIIPSQTAKNLPKSITKNVIYSTTGQSVIPVSLTPNICTAYVNSIYLLAGGTCKISYQSEPDAVNQASNVYIQSFEIVRDPQTIDFTLPAATDLVNKTLALNSAASSAGAVTFSATPTDVCSVSASLLNLLKPGACLVTATQSGTSTIAPVSKTLTLTIAGALPVANKTITCVKGKKSVKKTAISPKCPAGYKVKK
jgi:hypothetical protein